MRTIRTTGFAAFLSILGLCMNASEAESAPQAPGERSFRTVVPIKKTVPGSVTHHSRVFTVQIPPPFPAQEGSSLPEGNAPRVNTSPASENINERPTAPKPAAAIGSNLNQVGTFREKEGKEDPRTLARLREEAHRLARMGLTYQFGSDDPDAGGLDCSGAVQRLLLSIGIEDVPRTSYQQYDWLKRKKTLDDVYGRNSTSKMLKKLSPGDLIFWGGTWKSGHRVSHVMIYMGYNPEENKHYVFGARGKSSQGILGNGVDVFELNPNRGKLVAHGKIPGLKY
jgi:cell wall-associated NlpC family hydrolase